MGTHDPLRAGGVALPTTPAHAHNPSAPATFSYILLHIVFSTKRREAWITPDIKPRLYNFIGGIIRAENGGLLAIGGVEDHVHLLVRWNTDKSVGDLMRNVKARSSMWVHQTFPSHREFA